MQKPSRHLFFWDNSLLYATNSNTTEWHRHFGASIAISTAKPFRLETRKDAQEYHAALVPPNLEHRSIANETRMIVLMVDPDSHDFRQLIHGLDADCITRLDQNRFEKVRPDLDKIIDGLAAHSIAKNCSENIVSILKKDFMPPLDERIKEVLHLIRTNFPEVPSINALAKSQNLSANRLMTLFKKNLGLPIRRYLLWLRLKRCVPFLKEGSNLTDAAHAAGFADSAHLSRVFRENFGMKPSDIFSANSGTSFQAFLSKAQA